MGRGVGQPGDVCSGERAIPRYRRGDECGRYIIVDRIGSGAMGVVYSAFDPHLGRQVALKVVRPAALQQVGAGTIRMRLLREAQAMARLSHPNVVSVYDAGTDDRQVFLAMELVEGGNLRRHMAQRSLSVGDALALMVQAGRGLAAAHRSCLVHRDFKPENILVADDGRVCVTDFGLARPSASAELATPRAHSAAHSGVLGVTLTLDGDTVGTPAYMAPEQLAGRPADPRADQYAFCTTLFEVLFGRRPFSGQDTAALRSAKAKVVPEIPTDAVRRNVRGAQHGVSGPIPGWLRDVLRRGMQPKPEERFENMDLLLEEIERHCKPRRRAWKTVSGLLVVAAVGLATLGVTYRARAKLPCAGAGEPPTPMWSLQSRDAIRSAFADAAETYADDVAERAIEALDGRVTQWGSSHEQVCEATWVRGEQSPSLLDARMGCLRNQWSQLEATVDLLRTADADVVAHATRLVEALQDPRHCETLRVDPVDGPPTDPVMRARWEALHRVLSRADAHRQAGKTEQARADVLEMLPDVRELDHPSLLAQTLLVLGRLEHELGEHQGAEIALREGLTTATGAKLGVEEAEAWILLGQLAVDDAADFERGRFCAQMALSVVDDLGGDPRLKSWAHTNLGTLAFLTEDDDAALEHWQVALDLRRELLGPEHTLVASSLNNVGGALYAMGRLREAETHLREAERLRRELLGPEHPDVAESAVNLGLVLLADGRPDEALQAMQTAARILRAALGPEHPRLGQAEDGLGQAWLAVGQPERARVHLRHARELYARAHGPNHPALQHADDLLAAARAASDAP